MKKALFLVLATLAALILQAAPSQAYHSTGAHWPGGPEKGFVMVSDRSGGRVGNIDKVITQWNELGVYNIVNVGPVCPNDYAPHYCVTLYASSRVPPNRGEAITHIFAGNHILASDIFINPTGFANRATKDALLSHEFGHALGLNHRTDAGLSIMQTPVYPSYFPEWHDKEQLVKNRS